MSKNKKPTYNVTYEDIQGYVKKGYKLGYEQAIKKASDYSLAVPMMILRDRFGFGKKRLLDFYGEFLNLYDSVDKDYLDLKDIVNTIEEETGVNVVTRER